MAFLLKEDGSALLLDPTGSTAAATTDVIQLEGGTDKVLFENGVDHPLLEGTSNVDQHLLLDAEQAVTVTLQPLQAAAAGEATSNTRVSQFVSEILYSSPPSTVRTSQVVVEVLTNSNAGGITFQVPGLAGSGDVQSGVVSGTGDVTFGVPQFDSGFGRLTQEARLTLHDETSPTARLTQLGRNVGTDITHPGVRITQMARQVLYHYSCNSEPPPQPIDVPIVHVLRASITPTWKLERFDQKVRQEDGANTTPIPGVTPSWNTDGSRWKLGRLDIEWSQQDDTASTPVTFREYKILLENGSKLLLQSGDKALLEDESSHWRLERFDLRWRAEEIS